MARSAYIYHSPLGDRELTAHGTPDGGKVDLFDADGVLDIGACRIGRKTGECSPVEAHEADDDDGDALESHTVPELREKADALGIDHAGVKKAELIDLIRAAETTSE